MGSFDEQMATVSALYMVSSLVGVITLIGAIVFALTSVRSRAQRPGAGMFAAGVGTLLGIRLLSNVVSIFVSRLSEGNPAVTMAWSSLLHQFVAVGAWVLILMGLYQLAAPSTSAQNFD